MYTIEFIPHYFLWHLSCTALFILWLISSIIAYQSKERSFIYYAVYCFFLLLYLVLRSPYTTGFVEETIFNSRFATLNWYLQIVYNCCYFVFFIYFLDIHKYYAKFHKQINIVVRTVFSIGTLLFIYSTLFNQTTLFRNFFLFFFTPVLSAFAVYTVIKALYLPGKLKAFITIGSSVYIVLALLALILTMWPGYMETARFKPIGYFYIGIFIEQLVFALGLSYKVKVINQNLIKQMQENQEIKANQTKILEHELAKKESKLIKVTKKAEEERIANLKSAFENEIHQLHLMALQNQMNPHFIFNALNSIKVFLIENNKEQAVYYLNKFSKLIRKILENSRVDSISLKEELEIIQLYVGIENIRFEENIAFSIKINDKINLETIKVPPMILQPFVENAIWHGLTPRKTGTKKIDIHIYPEQEATKLTIKDNGIGRKKSEELQQRKRFKKQSIGLKITTERIEYFNRKHHKKYSFEIVDVTRQGENQGTEVVFSFI